MDRLSIQGRALLNLILTMCAQMGNVNFGQTLSKQKLTFLPIAHICDMWYNGCRLKV